MFAHELALSFGIPDVDAFLDSLTPSQLLRWQTFASQRGLPHYREDVMFALLTSLLYNSNRGENDPPENPKAFMCWRDEYDEDVSLDDLRERIRNTLHGNRTHAGDASPAK